MGRIERQAVKRKVRRDARERADRNDDGRVGRVERKAAKNKIKAKKAGRDCRSKGDRARAQRGQRADQGRDRQQGRRGGRRAGRGRSV